MIIKKGFILISLWWEQGRGSERSDKPFFVPTVQRLEKEQLRKKR
jgi:hypothetical protein